MVRSADDGQRVGGKWDFLQLLVGDHTLDQTDIQFVSKEKLSNLFGIIHSDFYDGLRIAFHKTGNHTGEQEAGQSHAGADPERSLAV